MVLFFFFSSRRRHTRCSRDWSSDVCSSDLLDDGARGRDLERLRDRVPVHLRGDRKSVVKGKSVDLGGRRIIKKKKKKNKTKTVYSVAIIIYGQSIKITGTMS